MRIGASPPVSITQPAVSGAPGQDRRLERDHGAMRLGVAPQREHIGVAVDDPGRGRQQRPLSLERGLERARLLAGEPDEIGRRRWRRPAP